MRSITNRIECQSRSDSFTIIPFGDVHWGNRACDEKAVDRLISFIANEPNTYWIGMGDFADAINRHDKRHKEDTYAKWLWGHGAVMRVEREYVCDKLSPIAQKCLAYIKGNHEDELECGANTDMYLDIMESFNNKNEIRMDMSGYFTLRFGLPNASSTSVVFYMHHGWGGGDRIGGACLKLDRFPEQYDADIYMMGHTHKTVITPKPRTYVDGKGNIKQRKTFLINTGTFLRTSIEDSTTYSERNGMQQLTIGCPVIHITPFSEYNKISVTI